MGAETIAQADDTLVAQIRKPDKVEALDVTLLDMPVKEVPGFANTIGSPDSVLNSSLQENAGEGASKLGVDSFTFHTVHNVSGSDNVDTGTSTSTGAATKEADKDVEAEGKINSSDVTSVAPGDAPPPPAEVKEDTGEEDSTIKTDDAVESPIVIVQSSTAKESIAHEIQEMEEISLEEDGEKKMRVTKGISALVSQPVMSVSKLVESFSNINQSTSALGVAGGSRKQSITVPKEEHRTEPKPSTAHLKVAIPKEEQRTESKPSTVHLKVAEGNVKEDALSNKEAPFIELKPVVVTETAVGEVQAKSEVPVAVERTEPDEKLDVVAGSAASAIEALPASRLAKASENQEASEPVTPPTPERSGTVIKLTRQMSRVSTGMGPMSPRFEIRAAKEIQDLQEKVKVMEEDLRRKAAVIETQSFNHKEREAELLYKIECLELANEQLLQGGNDSSIQLQMELTRLQRQNSVLQLRERELQFQINTQEMIKTQMLDKRPAFAEPVNPVKQLESKVAILESKLAEAVEVSNMYKIQLHEAFTRQKSMQSASLLNLVDGEDVLKELQKLRKQTKEQETEILDLQDRFFIISVRLAESAAQKEELLSKLKRLQTGK